LKLEEKKSKSGQNGSRSCHVIHFWNIGTPNISRTVKARNVKFSTYMNGSEYQRKRIQNRVTMGRVWDSLLCRKRLKLETSNLA